MPSGKAAQRGFTYLFVLMLVTLVGMGLAAAATVWQVESQRLREAELLFIGNQYRQAIKSYYELEPAQPRLPQSVDDLLADNRRPNVTRHLRKAWKDPVSGQDFELIESPDRQGFVGVRSPADQTPLKVAGFSPDNVTFADAATYRDWAFLFVAPGVISPPKERLR